MQERIPDADWQKDIKAIEILCWFLLFSQRNTVWSAHIAHLARSNLLHRAYQNGEMGRGRYKVS